MKQPINALALALLGACVATASACGGADSPTRGATGPQLSVSVAALTLPGITDARYNLRVDNADGAEVWTRLDLASTTFGDGAGGLTYVGPCDASASPNVVTLELVSLATSARPVPTSEYVNPCPAGSDLCQLPADCVANADTSVSFDVAIMRDAKQGFFDVAVNFDDIFCSAKVDCLDAFLHDGDERARTMVFGFACTAGVGQDTHLYLDDVVLRCPGQPDVVVDPSGGPGNMGARRPMLFQTASYRGAEQLSEAFDKCYWNTALGVDEGALPADCELRLAGTAAPASWEGGASPTGTIWPVVNWSLPLTDAEGTLQCGAHGLNGGDGVVTTGYTGLAGRRFRHVMHCADQTVETPGATVCTGSVPAVGDVSVAQSASQVIVTSQSGGDSVAYTLPAGLTVVSCCPDDCCDQGGL